MNRFLQLCALACCITGCGDDSSSSDAGSGDAGSDAPTFDSATDAMLPDGGRNDDSGTMNDAGGPLEGDVPGGPALSSPIVGCEDAERPARRLADAEEICEAETRCWYVSPGGSGDGSFANPFGTPQEGVREARPGDIIYLRGGVYGAEQAFEDSRGSVLVRIGHVDDGAGDIYDVTPGTEDAPITLRSFPGERACSDGAGHVGIGSSATNIAWWRIENLTVRGAAIRIGGGSSRGQTRDILILNNEVYGLTVNGGDNPGLVRINRGDQGGPARITVESNILHDLSAIDDGVTNRWDETSDAQHFGSVTTLSCETYLGLECGGTGEVRIRNNHIYNVPQAFFFKNPSVGPYQIDGNVIHHTQRLGGWVASNITFANNLVYEASGIGLGSGAHRAGTSEVFERAGHDLVVENNTFVGIDRLIGFKSVATGHVARGNIIAGLSISIAERTWDEIGYVSEQLNSAITDVASSELASGNDFDDNCFVTPTEEFIAYGRRYEGGLDHLSLADAREILGYELTSVTVADPNQVFQNHAEGDYRPSDSSACGTRGANIPEWWTP